MDTHQELYEIRRELQRIINELEAVSSGIRGDFAGIGNEQCAACVSTVAEKYRGVKRRIENIDTNLISEEYAKAHGGGSR